MYNAPRRTTMQLHAICAFKGTPSLVLTLAHVAENGKALSLANDHIWRLTLTRNRGCNGMTHGRGKEGEQGLVWSGLDKSELEDSYERGTEVQRRECKKKWWEGPFETAMYEYWRDREIRCRGTCIGGRWRLRYFEGLGSRVLEVDFQLLSLQLYRNL